MISTPMIVAAVVVVWAVLFVIFMILGRKRKNVEQSFIESNKDKALLHLYCRKIKIDGQKLSSLPHITGQNLQQIAALPSGKHTLEGIFQSTELAGMKTRNVESEKLSFELSLEAGHNYTAAMYFYSSEERKEYYKGNVGKVIAEIPLSLLPESANPKAYVIVYQED